MRYVDWYMNIAKECKFISVNDRASAFCVRPPYRLRFCSFEHCPLIPLKEKREYQ